MARPPIAPVRWQPPTAPARSRRPRSARPLPPLRLLDVVGRGPEDVLVDDAGRVLTGVADGRMLRLAPDNRRVEVLADTGGRPLGLEWLPDGGLLVCDARRGLLRADLDTGAVDHAGVRSGRPADRSSATTRPSPRTAPSTSATRPGASGSTRGRPTCSSTPGPGGCSAAVSPPR